MRRSRFRLLPPHLPLEIPFQSNRQDNFHKNNRREQLHAKHKPNLLHLPIQIPQILNQLPVLGRLPLRALHVRAFPIH